MKQTLSIFSLIAILSASAQAAALTAQASARNGYDAVDGTDLEVGNLVRFGWFNDGAGGNLSDSAIQASAKDPAGLLFLNSRFVEAATTKIGDGLSTNQAGRFSTSVPAIANAQTLAGKQIYFWVFRASNNTSVATTLATATETSIIYMPISAASSWAFPADFDTGTTTVSTSQLTDATTTPSNNALLPTAKVVVGQFGPGLGVTGRQSFTLAPVPEPTTFGLIGFGAVSLLARRRKANL